MLLASVPDDDSSLTDDDEDDPSLSDDDSDDADIMDELQKVPRKNCETLVCAEILLGQGGSLSCENGSAHTPGTGKLLLKLKF